MRRVLGDGTQSPPADAQSPARVTRTVPWGRADSQQERCGLLVISKLCISQPSHQKC